jgi:hypothetical protein
MKRFSLKTDTSVQQDAEIQYKLSAADTGSLQKITSTFHVSDETHTLWNRCHRYMHHRKPQCKQHFYFPYIF